MIKFTSLTDKDRIFLEKMDFLMKSKFGLEEWCSKNAQEGVLYLRKVLNLPLSHQSIIDLLAAVSSYLSEDPNEIDRLVVPGDVVKIPTGCFSNLGIKELVFSEGVKIIGKSAVTGCANLESIYIPSTVVGISPKAFTENFSLKRIDVSQKNTRVKSKGGVLFTRAEKCLLKFPSAKVLPEFNYEIPEGVRRIAPYAFEGATYLREVIMPDSVTTLEDGAFQNCLNLEAIRLSNSVTRIPHWCFFNCPKLPKDFSFPEGLRAIEDGAFCDSPDDDIESLGVRNFRLPSSAVDIADYAFPTRANVYREGVLIKAAYAPPHGY